MRMTMKIQGIMRKTLLHASLPSTLEHANSLNIKVTAIPRFILSIILYKNESNFLK